MMMLCYLASEGHKHNANPAEKNRRHFPDDILKCIFLNENVWILIKSLLKFVNVRPVFCIFH